MNTRRASTLVEIVMCMSLGSTLMLLAIGLVHRTLTIASRGTGQADQARSLARLASQFRSDAHRAAEARADSATELRMTWADQSEVIYRVTDQHITRTHKPGSGEAENESFALGDQQEAAFRALEQPDRAALLVQRQTELRGAAPRIELHVVAALNMLPRAEQGGMQDNQPSDEAGDKEVRP